MRKFLLIICTISLFAENAFSQDIFLKGKYVHLGIHSAGSFGSKGSAPSGYYTKGSNNLGFVCDIQKDGFNKGNPNFAGDYFIPGSPEEGWGIQWKKSAKGSKVNFNNFGLNKSFDIKTISHKKIITVGSEKANWLGEASSGNQKILVQQTVKLDSLDQHFTIEILMQNNGKDTLYDLKYFRNVDPDNEQTITGSYTTTNYIIDQPGFGGNKDKATVIALGQKYNIPCILGTIDSRAKVSIGGFAIRTPDDIFNNTNHYTKSKPNKEDVAISLAFKLGNIPPGKCVTLVYYYALQSIVPSSKIFDFNTNNQISSDSFKTTEVLKSSNICLSDTIVHIKTKSAGSGVNYIDQILWDTDDNDSFETNGDSIRIILKGFKKHIVKQRIIFCNGSYVDSVYTFELKPKPIIDFNYKINDKCFLQSSIEALNSSKFTRDSIQNWRWYINDTLVDTTKNLSPFHPKFYHNEYDIKLIGTSLNGCIDSASYQFKLLESPYINAEIKDTSSCFRENKFSVANKIRYSNSNYIELINWGDGSTDTIKSASIIHSYKSHGRYQIISRVVADSGCANIDSLHITIHPNPENAISLSDSIACQQTDTVLCYPKINLAYGSYIYEWLTTKDKKLYSDSIFKFTANDMGKYIVQLHSKTDYGCTDTISKEIFVAPKPISKFTFNDNEQCLKGNKLVLTDDSRVDTGTTQSYWKINNQVDTSSKFEFIASNHGEYYIYHTTKSQWGCIDSNLFQYNVAPQSNIDFEINLTPQCLNNNIFKTKNLTVNPKDSFTSNWSWNNEAISPGFNGSYSFNSSGLKSISLFSKTTRGCMDTVTKMVYVAPQANLNYGINNTTQCLRNNLVVTNNISNIDSGQLDYTWKINDSTSSSNINLNHKMQREGRYGIKLLSMSNFGCIDSLEKEVIIYPQTSFNIHINDTSQCLTNNSFVLSNSSTISSGTSSYYWDFDDLLWSNQPNPDPVTYSRYGKKEVRLIASSDKLCKDTVLFNLFVNAQPNSAFDLVAIDSCETNNQFNFTDLSTIDQGIYQRKWTLNSQLISTDSIFSYSFKNVGIQKIKFVITSGEGCLDSSEKSLRIYPNSKSEFQIDSIVCRKGEGLTTMNNSSIFSGNLNYLWNVDRDGFVSSDKNITNLIMDTGTYNIELIALSDFGCNDTANQEFKVVPNTYLDLSSTQNAYSCFNYNYFTLNPINTNENIDVIQNIWDWRDGTTTQGYTGNHGYKYPGEFNIKLTTTNTYGCTDTLYNKVRVLNPITLEASGDTVCFPELNRLRSTSFCPGENISEHKWIFPNGVQRGADIFIKMPKPGLYSGSLIVTTSNNCKDTLILTNILKVNEKPKADFKLDNYYSVGMDMNIGLLDLSYPDIFYWEYIFNESQWSNKANPTFQFQDTGLARIQLIVNTNNGCSDTVEKIVGPFYPEFFMHIPNSFSPNNDGVNDVFLPIVSDYIMRYEISIYNRWGALMFKSNDPKIGWDGIYNGKMTPPDQYIYILHIVDLFGKRYFTKGQILKIR